VKTASINNTELSLLLEAIHREYGYDFRDYSKSSILRRVQLFKRLEHIESTADLIKPVLHDSRFALRLIKSFSINISEMFRDPPVFLRLVKHVLPALQAYPSFKIWHAGCATGQEVYSLAILLKEAGLLNRATIFATDINEEALKIAMKGIYPLDNIQSACKGYLEAGGAASFTQYFHAAYHSLSINSELKQHITFANHNLVQDAAFGEMQLILCRNVLIYFNPELQKRAWNLLSNSLVDDGFICLGTAEYYPQTIKLSNYEMIGPNFNIYKKSV
jgi:chemotaxis protein methyltransferase CheR